VSLHATLVANRVACIDKSVPHADKFYLDIHRECFLERSALFPSFIVIAGEHLICKGDLLVVARREQTHL